MEARAALALGETLITPEVQARATTTTTTTVAAAAVQGGLPMEAMVRLRPEVPEILPEEMVGTGPARQEAPAPPMAAVVAEATV